MVVKQTKSTKRRINPDMFLLKLSMFLVFGATTSLIPYLTIHMQSIGLTVEEIATIYLTLLFSTFIAPPVSGFLVDKFGRYSPVILMSLVLNAVSHHCLYLIPTRDVVFSLPGTLMAKSLDGDNVEISWSSCNIQDCPIKEHLLQLIDHCLLNCDFNDFSMFNNQSIFNIQNSGNDTLSLTLSQNDTTDYFHCGGSIKSMNESAVGCLSNCHLPYSSSSVCPTNQVTGDVTFWMYLIVRFLSTVMMQASLTVLDAVALNMIENYGGDFGREKLFSSLGMAFFTPLTGVLIDYFSEGLGYTDYSPAFYMYDILLGLSLVSVYMMPIGEKQPAEDIVPNLIKIFKMPHIVVFIIFLFCLGNFWGFVESYLFVIMKEMGSPNYLLGLTYTVGTVVSIPLLFCAERITKMFGYVNLLIVAYFAHSGRIISYSFISNPFWCFPIECLEAVSCYFMWVVATMYCATLSPNNDLIATMIGVGSMVHFCLGKGIGSFFGGFLIGLFGTRMAFRYMGIFAFCGGVLYKIIHVVWLHKFDEKKTNEKVLNEGEKDSFTQDKEHQREEEYNVLKKRLSIVTKEEFGSLSCLSRLSMDNKHRNSIHKDDSECGIQLKTLQRKVVKDET